MEQNLRNLKFPLISEKNADRSGFGFVWDVSNGLSAIWMCMTCRDEITKAWDKIVEIAGTEFIQIPRFRK